MKSEQIIHALGKIDDRLVMEVFPGMPIRKNRRWITVLAAAAVIGVCIFGAGTLGLLSFPEETPSDPVVEPVQPDMVDWEYVKRQLLSIPAPEEISEETKLKFLEFFRENPDVSDTLLLTWGSWEWKFEMSDSYQNTLCPTLFCIGTTPEGVQTISFTYIDGEVVFSGRTVYPEGSVSAAIEAAFPGMNVTATVQLQDGKGQLQPYSYELLPGDGLDVGGKGTLSEELYMEELDLLGQSTYDPAGTLVFVDHQSIPSYFVEEKTGDVFLTCSGKVTNGYAVWAVRDRQLVQLYQLFLEKVSVYFHENYAAYSANQYTLQGTVKEIDHDNHVLVLDGQADGVGVHKGQLQVYFSDADHVSPGDCQLTAYAGTDCGFSRNADTFYTVGYAAEHRLPKTAEGCAWYISRVRDYMRILQNREPAHGNSCSVEIGDCTLFLELPQEWIGKYGMVVLDGGVRFYHLESKGAQAGGTLFTIQLVTDEQMTYAGFERLLFEGDDYKIGLFTPTDVQFTAVTAKDYQILKESVDAIVDSAFLEDRQKQAETMNWDLFEARFHQEAYVSGADLVGQEARAAVLAHIREEPARFASYFGGAWSWKRITRQGKEYAVLKCEAPLNKLVCVSQCLEYSYADKTVTWGASGSHGGDSGSNAAEIIRDDLRNWSESPDSITNLRKAFAAYFYEHPEQLQFMPSANEAAPHNDRQDAVVYYRLKHIELIDGEENIFSAEFEGMTLYREDLQSSENFQTLMEHDLWNGIYEDAEQSSILQAMSGEKSYKEQGIKVSENITVDFYLQDGENPFQLCACTREVQS